MRVVEEVVQPWRVSPNTSPSWCMGVRSDSERHPSLHLLFSSEELLTIGLSASFHYLVRLFARIAHHRPAFDLLTHSHLLCVSFLVGLVLSLASLLMRWQLHIPAACPHSWSLADVDRHPAWRVSVPLQTVGADPTVGQPNQILYTYL